MGRKHLISQLEDSEDACNLRVKAMDLIPTRKEGRKIIKGRRERRMEEERRRRKEGGKKHRREREGKEGRKS